MSGHLEQARTQVLEWLRAPHREPAFLKGEIDTALVRGQAEITEHFLRWAKQAGFDYEVVPTQVGSLPSYSVHWTHRGSSFVGFKQPSPESKVEDALLAGCAALLENQWCREWLRE